MISQAVQAAPSGATAVSDGPEEAFHSSCPRILALEAWTGDCGWLEAAACRPKFAIRHRGLVLLEVDEINRRSTGSPAGLRPASRKSCIACDLQAGACHRNRLQRPPFRKIHVDPRH